MKKYLLLITIAVIIVNCLLFSSCKKIIHYPHPSPGGVRLASYSLIGTSSYTTTASYSENDNYSFSYDTLNRLTFIVFTTNNPFKANTDASFIYSNDTIYKIITSEIPSIVLERDTFIVNSLNQIVTAYTPNITTTFQYYENLLTIMTVLNETAGTTVTNTYTSQVGNFLQNTETGTTTPIQNFTYYTNYTNRIGDYLQVNSFTMYGYNVYQYTNLVNTIAAPSSSTTTCSYNIDAYSNVTSTTASTISLTGTDTTTVYNFQYESY